MPWTGPQEETGARREIPASLRVDGRRHHQQIRITSQGESAEKEEGRRRKGGPRGLRRVHGSQENRRQKQREQRGSRVGNQLAGKFRNTNSSGIS